MIRAWSPPFTAMVRDWWNSASRVEHRHFCKSLVPNSLMARFKSLPWDSKEHFRSSLRYALAYRRKSLNETISATFALMRATPIQGCPTARVEVPFRVNQWAGEHGTFSTTVQPTRDSPPAYTLPPHFPSGSPESGPRALGLSPFKLVTQRWALTTPRSPLRPLPKGGTKGRARNPCLGRGLGVRQWGA